jgi:hypothetical protein
MPRPERNLSAFLTRLRQCVCDELADTLAGPVCRCSLIHSEVEVLDGCNCACPDGSTGRAVIRVVSIDSFTLTSAATMNPCPTGWLALLEINVTRCVLDCKAEIPPDETLELEALYALSDYAALKRAVICCGKQAKFRPEMRAWRPLGPDGCCYGGAMELTARIE